MSAQSSTVLPAIKVLGASTRALAKLRKERAALRDKVEQEFIVGWRKNHPIISSFYSDASVRSLFVPEGMATIPEQFRAHDESVLRALRDLANAAVVSNPTFTVMMTADDFRLVSDFFWKGE